MQKTVQRVIAVSVVSTSCLMGTTAIALAQQQSTQSSFADRLQQEGVRTRQRPEYDQPGIRHGSFLIYPSVETSVAYDSNVFQQQDDDAEFFYSIAPRVQAVSQWSQHAVAITASSNSAFYHEEHDENFTDYTIRAYGRLDVAPETAFTLNGGYQVLHVGRSDPDSRLPVEGLDLSLVPESALERDRYAQWDATIGFGSRFNRLSYNASIGFLAIEYAPYSYITFDDDFVNVPPGNVLGQVPGMPQDRDLQRYTASVEIAYDVSPGYTAFVRGEGNMTRYEEEQDRIFLTLAEGTVDNGPNDPASLYDRNGDSILDGFDRDSNGGSVLLGMRLELSNLIVGEFAGGYLRQNYEEDPRLGDIMGPVLRADLEWYPSPLLTARLTASRTVQNRIVTQLVRLPPFEDNNGDGFDIDPNEIRGASGGFQTSVGVGVDYEFRRNFLISADFLFSNEEFKGVDREDDIYQFNFRADYLINRNWQAGLFYDFVTRDSTAFSTDFTQHIGGIRLRLQL